MGFVPADALDVILCSVLVAEIALVDFCVRLVSNLRANKKMLSVMPRCDTSVLSCSIVLLLKL